MNFIRNGSYYIIAKYRDFEKPEIIPLKQSWYLENGINDFIYGNDIASIDLVTTKFSSVEGFKKLLNKEGLLKNNFVDLYIAHKHKYKGKNYLNTLELLFNQKDYRSELINKIANNRLNNIETKKSDIENFYNRFFNKINTRESFKKFFTLPFKPNNEYFSLEILKEGNALKLKYSNVIKDYITTRNIVNMWNLYDTLSRKYDDIDEIKKGDLLANDYINALNIRNNRRIDEGEIMKMIDKKQVPGQITMDEFLNNMNAKENKIENNSVEQLFLEERRIREEEPFDSPLLNDLSERLTIYEMIENLTSDQIKELTPKDRLKLHMIDYVDYKNIVSDGASAKTR